MGLISRVSSRTYRRKKKQIHTDKMGWLFDSPEEKMEKSLFNLKFATKSLLRESKKCEKDEKAEKAKVKTAIQKNNTEGARIHAENAIRNHNQALNYLRMAARVQTALQTQRVTKNMVNVCRAMEGAMASMNLEKNTEMMDRFENQFENLDVQTNMMESTMQGTTTQFVPENDVNQ